MRRAALIGPAALQAWIGASTLYLLALVGLAARRDDPGSAATPAGEPLTTIVLIPAHDEQAGLAETLEHLFAQDFPAHRRELIVIADNCTDATAAVARAAGATVWERFHDDRGKGQALDWGLERVWRERPETDAIVVIDADCQAAVDLVSSLEGALRRGAPAAQAVYDVANPDASPVAALRWGAFALKHRVRPRARASLGLSAGLFGTGMAFRADVLRELPWHSFSIAEDVEYHLALAEAGHRVAFVGDSRVESAMPTTTATAHAQQLRWESGNARLARRAVPLAILGLRRRDANLTLAGLELLLPPQTLLGPANLFCLVAAALLRSRPLALAAVGTTAGQAVYVVAGLRVAGAPPSVYRALRSAPSLAASKLAIFSRIARGRGTDEWLRTDREAAAPRPVEVA